MLKKIIELLATPVEMTPAVTVLAILGSFLVWIGLLALVWILFV